MAFQNPPFFPFATTNALGSFSVQSEGYVQGAMMDDPAIRNSLAGGTLASTETYPMWGGVALSEYIPGSTANSTMGGTLGRATSNANITGFSVLNQAYNWVITPQSPCPSAGPGMGVPFFRLGSGARIAVAMDPSLVSLAGGIINSQVSWDINNQCLQPYDASTATYSLTSITSSYSATTGRIAHARAGDERVFPALFPALFPRKQHCADGGKVQRRAARKPVSRAGRQRTSQEN